MDTIAKYFDYYSEFKIGRGVGLSSDNVYFKVLAVLLSLEVKFAENKHQIAHLNYLLGYYVGLFLHPVNGNEIAVAYIDKAIVLEYDQIKVNKYKQVKDLILEKM